MSSTHVDVLIVGAGLSGIGAACHLSKDCPGKSYAILEGRDDIGGTWDLFRYPGIRSDSDMYTLGFSFKPWTDPQAIADAPSIMAYLRDTMAEYQVEPNIRFGHQVESAAWDSATARWTVTATAKNSGAQVQFTCNFLHMCSGYYNYAEAHTPDFPGQEAFQGQVVHPQFWPEDLDYSGKNVVVIGSGATAVTLVPSMADTAASVTMLQRSPTYVVSRPGEDAIANKVRRWFGDHVGYRLTRTKNVLLGMYFFNKSRKEPAKVKKMILDMASKELGDSCAVDPHFTPSYNPWDQRMCLVPNSDLFKAIKAGTAHVVTDTISRFTDTGIALESGEHLDADIIVTATGLQLQFMTGMQVSVDGTAVDFTDTFTYKGMMFSGVPNLAISMGYTNASWTLKADLTCGYVCRLLNHMARTGSDYCVATPANPDMDTIPYMDLTSGYVQRAMESFPKQGAEEPWRLHQNYLKDLLALRYGKVEDGAMKFRKAGPGASTVASPGDTSTEAPAKAA